MQERGERSKDKLKRERNYDESDAKDHQRISKKVKLDRQSQQKSQSQEKKKKKHKSKKKDDKTESKESHKKKKHKNKKETSKQKNEKQIQVKIEESSLKVQKRKQVPQKEKDQKPKISKKKQKVGKVVEEQQLFSAQSEVKPKKQKTQKSKPKQKQISINVHNLLAAKQRKHADRNYDPSKQKEVSINVHNLIAAKQRKAVKKNFYITKQQNMLQGKSIGRGSTKANAKLQEELIQKKKKRIVVQKKLQKSIKLDKQLQKKEYIESQEATPSKSNTKKQKSSSNTVTKEESIKIIEIFGVDGGDYRGMTAQLKKIFPDMTQQKIRQHLRRLFEKNLQTIIQATKSSGRKFRNWQVMQKRQIVRQLHRIRSSNRLLSQAASQFRQTFQKMLMSSNDPSIVMTEQQLSSLYRRIQSFVRGSVNPNHYRNTKDKVSQRKLEAQNEDCEIIRPPLLGGGYMFNKQNRVKQQYDPDAKTLPIVSQPLKIDPQKIIYQWTVEEQRYLSVLYLGQNSSQNSILDQLKLKFGEKTRWKDFQLLGRKIDHMIKLGLAKLQQLTSKPYSQAEKLKEQEQMSQTSSINQYNTDLINNQIEYSQSASLKDISSMIYHNKQKHRPQEPQQTGIFKNISLLEKQIFASSQSYKVKQTLVRLMTEKYPPDECIPNCIKAIKEFSIFASKDQEMNGIVLIKSKEPIFNESVVRFQNPSIVLEEIKPVKSEKKDQSEEDLSNINAFIKEIDHEEDHNQGSVKNEDQYEGSQIGSLSNNQDSFNELEEIKLNQEEISLSDISIEDSK